jgi:hypothetical protein
MKPQIARGLPFADYLDHPELNCSLLKEIAISPGRLAWRRENPKEQTPNMLFGSAVDCLLFDGDEAYQERYVEHPGLDMRTVAGKAWKAANEGKQIVPAEVKGCARAVHGHSVAHGLIADGESQLSLFWADAETGIKLKARPDIYVAKGSRFRPILADLKTTDSADPEAFAKIAYRFRYHWQAAMYLDGLTACFGEPHDEAIYIVAERDPPHRVETMRLGAAELELGRDEYREALRLYARCKASNNWPMSSGEVQPLHFPGWAYK